MSVQSCPDIRSASPGMTTMSGNKAARTLGVLGTRHDSVVGMRFQSSLHFSIPLGDAKSSRLSWDPPWDCVRCRPAQLHGRVLRNYGRCIWGTSGKVMPNVPVPRPSLIPPIAKTPFGERSHIQRRAEGAVLRAKASDQYDDEVPYFCLAEGKPCFVGE